MQGNECWICDAWKYTVVIFSRKNSDQAYSLITDPDKLFELKKDHDFKLDEQILVQNKSYPLIIGTITNQSVISMTEISVFNLFQDELNIKKNLGQSGERAMKAILQVSQGSKNTWGKRLSPQSNDDWELRLKENLPYPEKDVLICNLPETKISRKLKSGEPLSIGEINQRKKESVEDVFVYAGFVPPGKHQIIINDQKTNQFFMREIVVDARARDIVNCSKY